ncbi:hypothetical protein [uncultured Legionella sp.]|uniref:hypothetical protein n=1 Tax=uncultured Legionella sp. TaxID=210934 RepID=UPI0026045BAA|nr:hypothetical protein [uncultured Legionella sp.]
MLATIRKYFDSIYNILNPLLGLIIVIFSVLASYDFSPWKHRFPRWTPLIELLSEYSFTILFIFAVSTFILSILRWFLSIDKTISTLSKELKEEIEKNSIIGDNIKNMFDGYLFHLATGKLTFSPDNDRVTLYLHDSAGKFIPFGRFSANPKFKSPGRSEYPDNQGVIALGWEKGWYFDCNHEGEDFINYNKNKHNIPKETLKSLRMKSVLYAVKRITDHKGDAVAIILVESTETLRFSENLLKEKLDQEEAFIADLITKFREHIPMPSTAKKRGL